jgi:hypothetical protein
MDSIKQPYTKPRIPIFNFFGLKGFMGGSVSMQEKCFDHVSFFPGCIDKLYLSWSDTGYGRLYMMASREA